MPPINPEAQRVAKVALATAHPGIKQYVYELEEELRKANAQIRSLGSSCGIKDNQITYLVEHIKSLEAEYGCIADDWDNGGWKLSALNKASDDSSDKSKDIGPAF